MFENKIEFYAHEDYVAIEDEYPIPAVRNIPEWFKKMQHTVKKRTIKGCMPFLDTLTSGYILKLPQDFAIMHNFENKDQDGNEFQDSFHKCSFEEYADIVDKKRLNLNTKHEVHTSQQFEGWPMIEKNKNLPVYKIANPWIIKTPPGYSCLFVPPLNNSDDRFSIIPGIVDTDKHPIPVNFPYIINGDKYPQLDTVLKKGTPYVQVIPFKRDSWKMEIKSLSDNKIKQSYLKHFTKMINGYKDRFWNKKIWK